jgi:enamine deaminase RidA (YjgF/YER057c/UK114 family)
MIEEKLAALDLALPQPAEPAFHYVAVTIHGGTAYVSGQLPKVDGEVRCIGKVGAEVSVQEAAQAARICILQGLACLKAALGNLGRVERVLKVTGFVASASGFNRQPEVIDAASRLLIDLFGEAGHHARSAVGVAELPRNAPVEIEMIVAVKDYSRDGHA